MLNKKNFANKLWDWLTAPLAPLVSMEEQRAARLAASFLLAIALLDLVGGIVRLPRLGFVGAFSGSLGFSLITTFIAYGLSRTKWYRTAIFLFSLSFGFSAYTTIASQGNDADFSALILVYVPLSLIVASSFLSSWAVFLLTGLNIAALLSLGLFGLVLLPDNIGAQSGIILTIGIVLILLANFRKNLEQIRLGELREINSALEESRDNLEQRVDERTAVAESARAAAEISANEAETLRKDIEAQVWLATGQTQLAEVMRGEQTLPQLAENVISQICQYTGAQAGALFVLNEKTLALVGRYAYTDRPGFEGSFQLGEGLVGQAAADGKVMTLDVIPSDALVISTGLADMKPRQLAAAPFYMNGEVVGVLELATLSAFTRIHLELWNRISESIGAAFNTVQTRQRLAALLMESQAQSEELQSQEEELRAANEELHAEAENLKAVREIKARKDDA